MRTLGVAAFVLWLIAGLYLGIGGLTRAKMDETLQDLDKDKTTLQKDTVNVSYDGLVFENQYELKYYLEIENTEKIFPWATSIPAFLGLIITAFAFGSLGSLIGLVKALALDGKTIGEVKVLSAPLLGALTGLVVLGLSYLLPAVLVKGAGDVRPVTLMFLCLFGGLFSKTFYEKIGTYFNKLFL